MIKEPVVSCITIFFNAEKYIREALESVFAQTYHRWELLLVDDGSTDGSTAIARHFARQHPGRVSYLEHSGHKNRGMSASRNLGIQNARGEYIAFLDADDVWLPHKLEQQVPILTSQPKVGMVYAPTQYWYSWAGNLEQSPYDFVQKLGFRPNTLVEPPKILVRFLRGLDKPPGTCSVLLRREVIERVGGFVESFQGLYEDQAFFAKICLTTPIFVVGEYSARYRQHPDSCCNIAEKTGQYRQARPSSSQLTFFNWLAEYLSKQGSTEVEVWKALQRKLWPYRHPTLYRLLEPAYSLGWNMFSKLGLVRIYGG